MSGERYASEGDSSIFTSNNLHSDKSSCLQSIIKPNLLWDYKPSTNHYGEEQSRKQDDVSTATNPVHPSCLESPTILSLVAKVMDLCKGKSMHLFILGMFLNLQVCGAFYTKTPAFVGRRKFNWASTKSASTILDLSYQVSSKEQPISKVDLGQDLDKPVIPFHTNGHLHLPNILGEEFINLSRYREWTVYQGKSSYTTESNNHASDTKVWLSIGETSILFLWYTLWNKVNARTNIASAISKAGVWDEPKDNF